MKAFVAVAVAVLIATSIVPGRTQVSIAAPVGASDVFPHVPEVRSTNGVARVDLDVILDPVSGYPAFSWNARLGVAPTIRVHAGDTIAMTVHDDMRPFDGRPNDVNVHFHGLIVSPAAPGDDAMRLARPGESISYRVHIPRDHEPGLYWYHPHAHGETYYDVTNGMSGAIVVEGIERHLPALASMRERVIVLRDVPTGPGFVEDDMPMTGTAGPSRRARIMHAHAGPACRPENGLQPTLNRQADAHIGIRPGERQFFRVVNASAARYYDLSVDDARLQIVELDGIPLDVYPGAPAVRDVSHVLVPPAGRAEFVVTAPRHPAVLRSACVDTGRLGDADPPAVLAHFVDPTPTAPDEQPHANPLRATGALPANVLASPLPTPAAVRRIRFTEDDRGFYINARAYRMSDPPMFVARSGTVERWTIDNRTDESHVFHMHQVHFATESVDGVRVRDPAWRDTVDVPPRRRVTVLIDFRDPVVRGTFVFHCHILDHEDQGMMATIRVR